MLIEIEEKIVARLQEKLADVSRVSVDKAHSALNLKLPVINVIVGGGTFSKVTMSQYKIKPQVFVIATFQNLRSEADRRKGVYPILLAMLALLINNKMGLAIDALRPVRLDNITEEKEADEGKIVFQIEFETGFIIDVLSDEAITDLLRVGLSYYLQDPADDHVADASDVVTSSQT